MAERKAFLVRLDPAIHEALQRWADADLRSVNAQIEFLLRCALRDARRLPKSVSDAVSAPDVTETLAAPPPKLEE
jgi:hypothetical protein